jgi:hypothetical protein
MKNLTYDLYFRDPYGLTVLGIQVYAPTSDYLFGHVTSPTSSGSVGTGTVSYSLVASYSLSKMFCLKQLVLELPTPLPSLCSQTQKLNYV